MLTNLFAAEQAKIFKRAILWLLLAGLAAITIAGNIIQLVMMPSDLSAPPAQQSVHEAVRNVTFPEALAILPRIGSAAGLGALLMIILVGMVAGQEYRWRSLHLWLSQGFSRPLLLGVKFLVLVAAGLLMVLTPVVVGGLHAVFLSQQFHGSLNLAEADLVQVLYGILRGLYSLLPYIALGFLLAVISRSTVAPVAGGIIFILIFEAIIPQVLPVLGAPWAGLAQFVPQRLGSALVALNRATGVPLSAEVLVEPWVAALGIALYTSLFLGAALLIFSRQDLA